jgi:hypothetical protein
MKPEAPSGAVSIRFFRIENVGHAPDPDFPVPPSGHDPPAVEVQRPGTDVIILKIFSPKNGKNWRFLLKAKLDCAKI